ncbi:24885_t:CDS:2, partial [Dentiscutata erythropus]
MVYNFFGISQEVRLPETIETVITAENRKPQQTYPIMQQSPPIPALPFILKDQMTREIRALLASKKL